MEDRIGNTCVEYEEDFLKDFPTAMEMRERKNSFTVKDKLALNEIVKLLNEAYNCTSVTYQGVFPRQLRDFFVRRDTRLILAVSIILIIR